MLLKTIRMWATWSRDPITSVGQHTKRQLPRMDLPPRNSDDRADLIADQGGISRNVIAFAD